MIGALFDLSRAFGIIHFIGGRGGEGFLDSSSKEGDVVLIRNYAKFSGRILRGIRGD